MLVSGGALQVMQSMKFSHILGIRTWRILISSSDMKLWAGNAWIC